MANPIWDFLGTVVKPITELIDEMHTSEEEKAKIKAGVFTVQARITEKVLDYERQLLSSQTAIITSEAQGQSWLQRTWRPITMLTFLALVVLDSFDLLAFRLANEAWTLLQIGLGGYVVGRSIEKVAPTITKTFGSTK